MGNAKKYPNRLGVKGWAVGGRWGLERYLYTLHRITGLGILFYFLLHILVTTSRAFGMEAWNSVMGNVSNTLFHVGEYLVYAAFCFHAVNGVRLFLVELGMATGPAIEPVYPYKTSVDKQRPLAIFVLLAAAVLAAIGGYDLFFMEAI